MCVDTQYIGYTRFLHDFKNGHFSFDWCTVCIRLFFSLESLGNRQHIDCMHENGQTHLFDKDPTDERCKQSDRASNKSREGIRVVVEELHAFEHPAILFSRALKSTA